MNCGYEMRETEEVSRRGIRDIEQYLHQFAATVEVTNVENCPGYRKKDIDIIWKNTLHGNTADTYIEVKVDRYEKSGNYFLETISNDVRQTPGCFLYTEADFIYYYFVNIRELHILPVAEAREWFKKNEDRFRLTKTSTFIGGKAVYNTWGRLIPKNVMREEVPEIEVSRI